MGTECENWIVVSHVLRWEVHVGTGGRSEEGEASGRRQRPCGVFREEKATARQQSKGRENVLMVTMLTAKSTESPLHARTLPVLTH